MFGQCNKHHNRTTFVRCLFYGFVRIPVEETECHRAVAFVWGGACMNGLFVRGAVSVAVGQIYLHERVLGMIVYTLFPD